MPERSHSSLTLWLSLVTSPFLLSLIVFQSILEGLMELGQASEELFRGDRLPILNIPEEDQQDQG